jgi:hypothetical protein
VQLSMRVLGLAQPGAYVESPKKLPTLSQHHRQAKPRPTQLTMNVRASLGPKLPFPSPLPDSSVGTEWGVMFLFPSSPARLTSGTLFYLPPPSTWPGSP